MNVAEIEVNVPIRGRSLIELFALQGYPQQLFPERVAMNAPLSLEKIRECFEAFPQTDGTNVKEIITFREALFDSVADPSWVNAFAIVAPHTHWGVETPAIYEHHAPDYIIGPHTINPQTLYYPTSFVFTKDGPLPYEWATQGILPRHEWEDCMSVIHKVNQLLWPAKWPLGIAIDFRFKDTLTEISKGSVELPIDEEGEPFYGFSRILSREHFLQSAFIETTEQVSWHPRSDRMIQIDPEDISLLQNIRNAANAIGNRKKIEEFLNHLDRETD